MNLFRLKTTFNWFLQLNLFKLRFCSLPEIVIENLSFSFSRYLALFQKF